MYSLEEKRKSKTLLTMLLILGSFFFLSGVKIAFCYPTTKEYVISHDWASVERRLQTVDYYGMSEAIDVGAYSATYYQYGCGLIFENVDIPKNSEVRAAYLSFICRLAYGGVTVRTRISCEQNDTTVAFASKYDFDSRWVFSEVYRKDWDSLPAWVAGNRYNSTDFSDVIEHVFSRSGWVSANNVTVFWDDFGDRSDRNSGCIREGYGWYASDASKRAILHIEYGSVFYATVYYNSGGAVEINGAVVANASVIPVDTIICNVSALVESNDTFTFSNFTISGTANFSNPYFRDMTSGNFSIWSFFNPESPVGGVEDLTEPGDLALLIVLGLICVPVGIILLVVIFRRRH